MNVKSRSEVKDRLLTFWRMSFIGDVLLFSVVLFMILVKLDFIKSDNFLSL